MGIQKYDRNTGRQKFRHILATHTHTVDNSGSGKCSVAGHGISSVETQAIQTTQLVTHDKWEDERWLMQKAVIHSDVPSGTQQSR